MQKKQNYVEPQAEVLEVHGEAFICASIPGGSGNGMEAPNSTDGGTSGYNYGWD